MSSPSQDPNECERTPSPSPHRDQDEPVTITRSELQRLLRNQEEMLKKQHQLEEQLANEIRTKKKIRPSVKVKSTVRSVYNGLAENGHEWDTSKPFGHQVNKDVNDEIKKGVKNQLSEEEAVIQVAMKTYFFTKRKEKKRANSGKTKIFRQKQARRQRKQQKLARRKDVLEKSTSIESTRKAELKEVLQTAYISSEDTDTADDFDLSSDDDLLVSERRRSKPLRKRPLLWRSKTLNEAFAMLDQRHAKKLKKMGGCFIHERREGAPSDRPSPEDAPSWAIKYSILDKTQN
ncbi:uncharacterized protein [Ptychodera flava]|uniref:uncharacterized protein n=1 Tax=Ptychodera flava TaxID=63121 RepID=UPI00396A7E25